jgi:hypothetical protein
MFVSLLSIDVFSEAYDESLDFGEDDAPASPGTQMNSPAQGMHNPQTPTRKRSNNNTPTNPHTARRLQRSMSSPMTPFQRLFRGQAQGNSRFAYATPLKMQILTEYYNFFLQTNVRVALQAKEEQQALAANVLMRRLLCELYKQTHSHNAYTFSRELLKLTTGYVSFHFMQAPSSIHTSAMNASTHSSGSTSSHGASTGPALQAAASTSAVTGAVQTMSMCMVTRALSVSKLLSTSSMQVVNDLIFVSTLQHAIVFVTKCAQAQLFTGSADKDGTAQTPTKVPPPQHTLTHVGSVQTLTSTSPGHIAMFLAASNRPQSQQSGGVASATTMAQTDYITLCAAIANTHAHTHAHNHRSVDARLAHIVAVLTHISNNNKQTNANNNDVDDPTIEKKGKGMGLDQQSAAVATEAILARVAERSVPWHC